MHISDFAGSEKVWNNSKYNNFTLWVQGGIVSEDLAIGRTSKWSDFVFDDNYKLSSLTEVENFINNNKHLPHIPSAAEVKENGYTVNDMNRKLLQTIEELMLHTIAQEKKLKAQGDKIDDLTRKLTIVTSTINNKKS